MQLSARLRCLNTAAWCRLLVQAVQSSTGRRARHVEHLVSEAFVVATQRVKQALKSEIPHMEHHVSKLEFVGVQTQLKLQDIRAAAATAGVVGLSVVHNCVTTGLGPFLETRSMPQCGLRSLALWKHSCAEEQPAAAAWRPHMCSQTLCISAHQLMWPEAACQAPQQASCSPRPGKMPMTCSCMAGLDLPACSMQ